MAEGRGERKKKRKVAIKEKKRDKKKMEEEKKREKKVVSDGEEYHDLGAIHRRREGAKIAEVGEDVFDALLAHLLWRRLQWVIHNL